MKNVCRALLPVALLAFAALPARAAWLEAGTEHFRFVFEEQDRPAVNELLTFCEEVYASVCGFFGSYPGVVPVVIRGRIDYTEGLTAPFPSHLELYVTPMSWPYDTPRMRNLLRTLLVHELTHYVHITMDRGIFHAISQVLGPDAAWGATVFLPGWMVEGPTTNTETIFTTGGRGRNPFFEVEYQAPIEDGTLFSLGQAAYSSDFPPSGRIYVSGYILVHYLLEHYGEDAFTRVMDDYLRFPFFGPWAAIRRVTGAPAGELFAAMQAELEERYRPRAEVPGGSLVTPSTVGDWYHPVLTDRGVYAYRQTLDRAPAIVRLGSEAIEEVLVTGRLTDPESFTASADGRLVCYAALDWDLRPTDGERATSDLWLRDLGAGRTRRLTTGAHLWHPALSANGSSLVAVQVSGSCSRLASVDLETGALRVLFSVAGATVANPAISPDGSRIAFTLDIRGFQDACVIDAGPALAAAVPLDDPRAPVTDVSPALAHRVLGPDAAVECFPRWDGASRLLFSSDRTGSIVLYEADLATGVVTLVQQDPVAACEGVIQGTDLLYASYSSKGWCLKSSPLADPGARPAIQDEAVTDIPQPEAWTGAAVPATPYVDVPRPYLWYPLVTMGSAAGVGFDPGIGVQLLAGSLLGTTSWQAAAAWHPLTSQPEIALAGSAALGPLRLGASCGADYALASGASARYSWLAQAGVSASLPLWAWSLGNQGSSALLALGVVLASGLASASPFTFPEVLNAPSNRWGRLLQASVSAQAAWVEAGAPIDFYYRRAASLAAAATVQLPAFGAAPGTRLEAMAEAVLPAFGHVAARLGLKAAYGIAGLDLPFEPLAEPRGFGFAYPQPSLPGRGLASLDVLVPIAALDQPLPFNLGLTGISAGFHVEVTADWSVAPASLEPGSLVYFGTELTLEVGSAAGPVPLTVGLAARFDTASGWRFDAAEDLRPYIAVSFDTFGPLGTGRGADGTPGCVEPRPCSIVPAWN